tara:strand:- start:93 stop:1331 length:1239 start_codon:yes stop_codon:yes gene_type:complete
MPSLPTEGPLKDLKVLDLTWVLSGPFATMTLSDLGADVIKVERPPYGDVSRTTGPLVDGESGYFFSVNRGKRSISVNLKSDSGKDIFKKLVREVDVLVENFTPGVMSKLGLGYSDLSKINDRLIYAAISGYGQTGIMSELPALDVIVQGAGGVMSITGEHGGIPVRPGLSLADVTAGLYCAIGILSAVHERERSGKGQLIDISMLDSQIAILENAYMRYHVTGEIPEKLGTRHPTAVPFQAFATLDGYIVLALAWGVPNQWGLLCAELELPELIDDERFSTAQARSRNHSLLEPLLSKAFLTKNTQDWVSALSKFGIPCGPLNDIPTVTKMDQVKSRNMFVDVPHHTIGNIPLTNTPIKLSRSPGGIKGTSPDMGQDTEDILKELLKLNQSEIEDLLQNEIVSNFRPSVDLG